MPNNLKSSPVGIDKSIQSFQTWLYGQVKRIWGIDDNSLDMYGRAYRNQTEDGYTPEVFTGGNEYHELFINDKVAATCFFGVKDTIKVVNNGYNTADVFAIFTVNLDKIKTPNKRQDEEAKLDVELLASKGVHNFQFTGSSTGIDTVFAEYKGWRKSDGIKYRDMNPFFCFRINFTLTYKLNNKCGS